MNKIQKLTNHPVHIVQEGGELSPTALIPFCEFGRSMSVMGVKIDRFDVPVCNSFKAKVYKDQLCYTVDPNEYKDKIDLEGQLSLTFAIDYNEDRIFNFSVENQGEGNLGIVEGFDEILKDFSDSIIIETIGKKKQETSYFVVKFIKNILL